MNRVFGKKKLLILASIFIIAITSIIYIKSLIKTPFNITNDKEIEVKNGDTLYSVITKLNSDGVIKNSNIVKAYIKYKKYPGSIKPGLYMLRSDESIDEFVKAVNKGTVDKNTVFVTIPEGYTAKQIGTLLEQKGVISKDAFIKACNEYKLPDYIKDDNKRIVKLEGFLFPDTYELKKGMDGKVIIKTMLTNFDNKMINLIKQDNLKLEKSKYDEIINMASIIEAEAEQDNERSTIASVFYNRLKINMKLQSNATVEYILDKHKERLYNKDIQIQSGYNTYIVNGLPEGPICNPSIKSIEAAIRPSNTNYIYFMGYDNGTHFFTDDYKKFEEVKKQVQGSY